MIRHRQLFAGLGLVSILFAIGLLLVPAVSSVGPVQRILRSVEAAGTTRMLLVTGGGLIGYLLVGLRSPDGDGGSETNRFQTEAASEQLGPREGVAGYRLDKQVQTAIDDGGEAFVGVRGTLQQTAISVYAGSVGCSEQQARLAVERGAWCSDSLAAAFLAEADGPSIPLETQLRLFVFPRRERRRRIERTVAVIERVQRR